MFGYWLFHFRVIIAFRLCIAACVRMYVGQVSGSRGVQSVTGRSRLGKQMEHGAIERARQCYWIVITGSDSICGFPSQAERFYPYLFLIPYVTSSNDWVPNVCYLQNQTFSVSVCN